MKKMISLCMSFIICSQVSAANFDGCYQTNPNDMYPAFCLAGTNEEGVGRTGARLAIYYTNTDVISHCLITKRILITNKELVFNLGETEYMVLTNFEGQGEALAGDAFFGNLEGDVLVGDTKFRFYKMHGENFDCLQR